MLDPVGSLFIFNQSHVQDLSLSSSDLVTQKLVLQNGLESQRLNQDIWKLRKVPDQAVIYQVLIAQAME